LLTSLSISLFYAHETAGIWSLFDLANNRGVIAPDDLSAEGFYQAQGGLQLDHDRFHTFLRTSAAGDLTSYVYFLLGSLVLLADRPLPKALSRLATDELGGEDLSRLLWKSRPGAMALSYLDPRGNAPPDRLSPYFEDIEIPAALWRREAILALNEYFAVAAERARGDRESRLGRLATLWIAGRGQLTA
jgi:hypothetical protein